MSIIFSHTRLLKCALGGVGVRNLKCIQANLTPQPETEIPNTVF